VKRGASQPDVRGTPCGRGAAAYYARRLVSTELQSDRNIGSLIEHTNDYRGLRRAVGDPLSPCLDPDKAVTRNARIRAGCRQPRGGIAFNLSLGLSQRGQKGAGGLVALVFLIMQQPRINLTRGPLRLFNQTARVAPRFGAAVRLASVRMRLSRMRW
jgi:hypothetical protein